MLQKKQTIKVACRSHGLSSQSGVVIIVALVMLLVMTMMGITSLSGATLQERMSGNDRQRMSARINAEAALRAGETFLDGLGGANGIQSASHFEPLFLAGAADHLYMGLNITVFLPTQALGFDVTDSASWSEGGATSFVLPPGPPGAFNGVPAGNFPRYIIEYIGRYIEESDGGVQGQGGSGVGSVIVSPFIFRIIAIGWAQDTNAFSVLQSIYITAQG